jgi:hypothetical protein
MGQGKGITPQKASLGYGSGTSRESKSQARGNSQKDKADSHEYAATNHCMTRPGSMGGGGTPKHPTNPTKDMPTGS